VARRRFDQHFLVDDGIIHRFVRATATRSDDNVLEIGPGQGALTRELVHCGCRLTLVEIDPRLVTTLQERFPDVHVLLADILKVDQEELLGAHDWRIVGSLPYSISSPLLLRLLAWRSRIKSMYFILQDEVVQRLAAVPGSRQWGRIGVMIQQQFEVQPLFAIPPEAFHPRPAVMSRAVRMAPRDAPSNPVDPQLFARLTKQLFSKRRKIVANTLKNSSNPDIPAARLEGLLKSAGIDPGCRPETLSIENIMTLTAILHRERTGRSRES